LFYTKQFFADPLFRPFYRNSDILNQSLRRAGAILDRFLHHAQTIAITGRSYRLKDHASRGGKRV
jgi:DNA replication protein DnaC